MQAAISSRMAGFVSHQLAVNVYSLVNLQTVIRVHVSGKPFKFWERIGERNIQSVIVLTTN